NSDNVTVDASVNVTYAVPSSRWNTWISLNITNLTNTQKGWGYMRVRLAVDRSIHTTNNIYLTIAEIHFNTTAAVDTTSPSWYDLDANVTNNTAVASGSLIEVRANWTDDTALNWTWLETNGSGSWVNQSYTALNGFKYNWSNLTLDTTGYAGGTIFLMRIYANDSSNNDNVTGNWVYKITAANNAPEVRTVTVDDNKSTPSNELDIYINNSRIVWCNATIYDAQGFGDISSVNATLRNVTSGSNPDNNDHYVNSSCGLSAGSGYTKDAWCKFEVWYYASPGSWNCTIFAWDSSDASGYNQSNTTLNEALGIRINEESIEFGNLNLGFTPSSTDENTTVIRNTGNKKMDISLYESSGPGSLTCSEVGNIDTTTYVEYSVTQNFAYGTGNKLQASTTTLSTFNLDPRQDDTTDQKKSLYWKIAIPTTGVGGYCDGTVTITAVSDA
ncbi:MAG: hypothetical protein ACTSPB_07060, partial [Candidatus Thorarchaeota archaeon]